MVAPEPVDRTREPGISFGSWAFSFGPFSGRPWSFEDVCRFTADAGYDAIEINGFRPHPHDEDLDSDAACADLRRFVDDLGLGISAYAPDFTTVPPAEAPLESYLRRLDSVLAFCRRMGITAVRTDTVTGPDAVPPDQAEARFGQLVTAFAAGARRCADAGVTLLWEFEPGFWLNRPSQVVRLLTEVGEPNFRVLFDSAHAYTGAVAGARHGATPELLDGGEVEYARRLAPWLGHLHLIDSDGSLHDDDTSNHLPFGTGGVDFAGVLDALGPAVAGLPWWTVDFCFCPTTEADAGPAVPYVRSLLDAVRSGQADEVARP